MIELAFATSHTGKEGIWTGGGRRRRGRLMQGPMGLEADDFAPSAMDRTPKYRLPNCTECIGCNTELSLPNDKTTFLGSKFNVEHGNTGNWLLHGSTPFTPSGRAYLKVFCMPMTRRQGARPVSCNPSKVLYRMKLVQATTSIAQDCGLSGVLPKIWFSKVSGIIPGLGFHVRWTALWMSEVPGISLEAFLSGGSDPPLPLQQRIDLLNTINGTQVVQAALFDLLTSQCDRHPQNVMLDTHGNLMLIDNEACLKSLWVSCAFDSMFLPSTQKFNIVRLGNAYVLKQPQASTPPTRLANPAVVLDYRCFGKGAKMFMYYPKATTQCLQMLGSMSELDIMRKYGLPHTDAATNLKTRVVALRDHGFEWAMQRSEPTNPPPKTYRHQPPCCKLRVSRGNAVCQDPDWVLSLELPFGDPVKGTDWDKPRADPGKYEGGTVE